MTMHISGPTPVTTLKPTPTLIVRATMIGDLLGGFGFPSDHIRIAQEGYAEGLIRGVTVYGYGGDGYIYDEAVLMFDDVVPAATLSIDTSGGRSMTEAVSRSLARAFVYSIETMRRKGLKPSLTYHFTNRAPHDYISARFNLSDNASTYRPGYSRQQVFSVRPGADRGTHYAHYTARAGR